MKNVFLLIPVYLILGIYSCGNKSTSDSSEQAEIEQKDDGIPIEPEIEMPDTSNIIAEEPVEDNTIAQAEKKGLDIKKEKPVKRDEKKNDDPAKPIRLPNPNPEPPKTEPKPFEPTIASPKPIPPKPTSVKQEAIKTETTELTPSTSPIPTKPEKPAPKPFDHSAFDKMLRNNVSSDGKVDYAAFKKQIAELNAYLVEMEAFAPKKDWSKSKKMAYWLNLYNAWMIKAVADAYPINSPMDLDGGNTWKVKRAKSGSNTYSLDAVENQIIRPTFKDARIHFAVNCAAKSCPPLLNRAWTESNLESYLEKQTKDFINNPQYNKIETKKVQISKIFEWYAADFEDIITFLNKYSNTKIDSKAKIEYLEYNWELNKK